MKKHVIYPESNDEIEDILKHFSGVKEKIIAVVAPEGSVIFDSADNLRTMNEEAVKFHRVLVIVTNDDNIIQAAAIAKLRISETMNSQPFIPELEPIELSDQDIENAESVQKVTTKKKFKVKKIKNFINFKKIKDRLSKGKNTTKIIAALILLVLIAAPLSTIAYANSKHFAEIQLTSDIDKKSLDLKVKASSSIQDRDFENSKIPLVVVNTKKTYKEKVIPTGQKNVGEYAIGEITVTDCRKGNPDQLVLPIGTTFTSGSFIFVSTSALALDGPTFKSGKCNTTGDHIGSVTVKATNAGDQYNLSSGKAYTISGVTGDVTAIGSVMGGGTNKVVKIISESDRNAAVSKYTDAVPDEIKNELISKLEATGQTVLENTSLSKRLAISATPEVNTEIDPGQDNPVIEANFEYKMQGYKRDDLDEYIKYVVNKEVNGAQKIQVLRLEPNNIITLSGTDTEIEFNIKPYVEIGPNIDLEKLKEELTDKKSSEIRKIVESKAGVKDSDIKIGPLYKSKSPASSNKIKLYFAD